MIDLYVVAKFISMLAASTTIISGLWILRNFKRYTCPVFITSATMIASCLIFLFHSWHTDIPEQAAKMHILMDLSFIMMSLVLTKCAFKADYIRQQCMTKFNNPDK